MRGVDWEERLIGTMGEYVVNKSKIVQQQVSLLPRFIGEYLIGMFSEHDGMVDISGLEDFVNKKYPERRQSNIIKNELKRFGSYEMIDEYKVQVDLKKKGEYKCTIPQLDITDADILPEIVEEHSRLLVDGVWGLARLEYRNKEGKIVITKFKPMQLSSIDIVPYIDCRSEFDLEEWMDILLSTLGFNPEAYDSNNKIVIISRLIPLVEQNVNIIELAPKGTGKTYMLRNVSSYSRVISGGAVSPATLFYHLNKNTKGLLAVNDCVVFDEIQNTKFKDPEEMVGKLKDYMESGNYDRGEKKVASDCSIMLLGNMPTRDGEPDIENYFSVLPTHLQETAFLDRLHGFIPGWQVPRIQDSSTHLTKNWGFAADYFSEVLHSLRNMTSFYSQIQDKIFLENADIRDEKSILRLASGFSKLLCPNGEIEDCLDIIMDTAVSYRQRVCDQLHKADPEYKLKTIKWEKR